MKTLLTIIQMLPALIQAVRQIEEFVPLPGAGKQKLELILGIVEDTVDDAKSMIPTIAKVVGRIVGLANAAGVFAKEPQR